MLSEGLHTAEWTEGVSYQKCNFLNAEKNAVIGHVWGQFDHGIVLYMPYC